MTHKNIAAKLAVLALVASSSFGLAAVSIVSPISTPIAQANWLDYYVPVGAFLRINGKSYYMGTLNDPSQIFGNVSWQINTENGILLKGYGNTPGYIVRWVLETFGPIRAQ
jgi:hypothetical protein